jgi:hypothetical protein
MSLFVAFSGLKPQTTSRLYAGGQFPENGLSLHGRISGRKTGDPARLREGKLFLKTLAFHCRIFGRKTGDHFS